MEEYSASETHNKTGDKHLEALELDMPALRATISSHNRDGLEASEIKKLKEELSELQRFLDKICNKVLRRLLSKPVEAEQTRQKARQHRQSLAVPPTIQLSSDKQIVSSVASPPLATPRRHKEHFSDAPVKEQLSDSKQSISKDEAKETKGKHSSDLDLTQSLLKGAIRYSSNLPLMLFNQMKQSKVIKGKRQKDEI